jgi:hypothetical protein
MYCIILRASWSVLISIHSRTSPFWLNVDTSHCILLIRSPSPISPSNQLYNVRLRRSNVYVFQSRTCIGAATAENITSTFRFWIYLDIVKTKKIKNGGCTRLEDEFEWKYKLRDECDWKFVCKVIVFIEAINQTQKTHRRGTKKDTQKKLKNPSAHTQAPKGRLPTRAHTHRRQP